jgi:hypothetical protein
MDDDGKPTPMPQARLEPEEFPEFLASLPEWEHQLLTNHKVHDEAALEHLLTSPDGRTVIVSHGSVSTDKRASFAWIIATNAAKLGEGAGPAQGHPNFMSSFRAEGYGCLASFRFLLRFIQHKQIEVCNSWIYFCDNKGLILRMQWEQKQITVQPSRKLATDYDLECCISQTATLIDCSVTFQHVKGHQDDTPAFALSWEATLNVECDIKQRNTWLQCINQQQRSRYYQALEHS